ncbi:MAG: hypothetical protein ACLR56_11575 [Oscillospiraceae bacterium]
MPIFLKTSKLIISDGLSVAIPITVKIAAAAYPASIPMMKGMSFFLAVNRADGYNQK